MVVALPGESSLMHVIKEALLDCMEDMLSRILRFNLDGIASGSTCHFICPVYASVDSVDLFYCSA